MPNLAPDQDLLIVENDRYLQEEGDADPKCRAVAIVRVARVREFVPEDVQAACANSYQKGYFAWELTDIRPITLDHPVPAIRGIYKVEINTDLDSSRRN